MTFSEKCKTCVEYKRCKDSFSSWIFFIIGLIATLAMRIVTLMGEINPIWGKLAWYIGIVGFFIFFIYQFKIHKSRSKVIKESNILAKTTNKEPLESKDYDLIQHLLCSVSKTKESINYFFIFASSAIAFILALYFDIIK